MTGSQRDFSTPEGIAAATPLRTSSADGRTRVNGRLSTTAMRLRQQVLELILSGEIASGRRLDQRRLAKRLKTTTAPLREALAALQSEGLLVQREGMGIFCRVYSVPEIEELVEIRGVLEGLAARRATAHITDAEIEELSKLATELGRPFQPSDEDKFLQSHMRFHKRIIQISRSPRLEELLEYHHVIEEVLANIAHNLWGSEPHDHVGLVKALATRNADAAERAMIDHIAPTYRKRFTALRARYGEGLIFPSDYWNT